MNPVWGGPCEASREAGVCCCGNRSLSRGVTRCKQRWREASTVASGGPDWTGTWSQQFRWEGLRGLKWRPVVETERREERTEGKQTLLSECWIQRTSPCSPKASAKAGGPPWEGGRSGLGHTELRGQLMFPNGNAHKPCKVHLEPIFTLKALPLHFIWTLNQPHITSHFGEKNKSDSSLLASLALL